MTLMELYDEVNKFQNRVNKILGKQGTSIARLQFIRASSSKLNKLSLIQDRLFNEALQCIEHNLYRSAHVSGWGAFIDFVAEKLGEDGYKKINGIRNWKVKNSEELREIAPDYVMIGCLEDVGLIKKPEAKSLRGDLAKRNECGHPSTYQPGFDEALGYVAGLLNRIESLQLKKIP